MRLFFMCHINRMAELNLFLLRMSKNLFGNDVTSSSRPIGCKGKEQRVEVFQPAVFLLGFGRNCLLIDLETV